MEFDLKNIDLKEEASIREKAYFAVILILILVSFARWLYVPELKAIKTASVQISNLNLQIDTLKKFESLTAAQPVAAAAAATNPAIEKIIGGTRRGKAAIINEVLVKLNSKELMRGLTLGSTSITSEADQGNFIRVPITLGFTCSFAGISYYLSELEKLELPIIIDNIELQAKEDDRSTLNGRLNVDVYVIK